MNEAETVGSPRSSGPDVAAPRDAPAPFAGTAVDWRRVAKTIDAVIAGSLALLVVALVVRSLGWRMEHDVPLAHYSAFMRAEYGIKPYEGLFEISFPGTILTHLFLTKVFGYGDLGLMIANTLWLCALGGVTVALMKDFGRAAAVVAVALFGIRYFVWGPGMIMQRDCILILFIATAVLLHVRAWSTPFRRRALIGFLVGVAAVIKPHAAVGLIPILVADLAPGLREAKRPGAALAVVARALASYGLGFAVPCGFVFVWLLRSGGLPGWLEMSRSYLPLYLQMTGGHESVRGAVRLKYVLRGFLEFGGHTQWFLAAGVGAVVVLTRFEASGPRARLTRLLLGEAAAFAVYPALSGQFWPYHTMPLVYFLALLASLCLADLPATRTATEALAPRAALVLTLVANMLLVNAVEQVVRRQPPPKDGQVDEIAAFLQANLRPGDTVQPLDWTGGVAHAMLIARARLATRFMYDYHFHHDVSKPFIQLLRRRAITEISAAKPRFVVEYFGEDKPWPSGLDASREFPELTQLLAADYAIDVAAPKYRIYERRAQAN